MSVYIIAEIGINHNGSLDIAKKLIDVAAIAGCDAVKFQKRTPETCVPEEQKQIIRDTPWGKMTYLDYKFKLEFGKEEYDEIDSYCSSKNIEWFVSAWDVDSLDFAQKYSDTIKIPSAHLINDELLKLSRNKFNAVLLSTGMSNELQIEHAVDVGRPDVIFHTNSTYPTPVSELNLEYISWLKNKYKDTVIGYSGHEFGLVPTFSAVTLGAMYVERHITLDRTMWGSDQMASVEPGGLLKLVKGIRDLELALKGNKEREVLGGELAKLKTLRG